MADKLDEMRFKSSVADPNVWMRPYVSPDGEEYYEYILMYVEDILAISMQPRDVMKDIEQRFRFNNDKVEEPYSYLGARLQKKVINGWYYWAVTSLDYVKASVATVEEAIKMATRQLSNKVLTSMVQSYLPEPEAIEELEPADNQFFQELIVMLRWDTEIVRVDVLLERSLLSQYQALLRVVHMVQALHIFNNDKVEEPYSYLGARLQKKVINGWYYWAVTSLDYVKASVATVEEAIKMATRQLSNKVLTSMVQSYLPEPEAIEELEPADNQFFQELIVMLRWDTEIVRVDVLLERSLLSQYQALLRVVHMVQALHIFAYLKKKPKLTLYYYPGFSRMDYSNFRTKREDFWEHFRHT